MPEIKGVKTCPNEKCRLHIDKKTFGADIECCPECGEKLVYATVEEKPKFNFANFVKQAVVERLVSGFLSLFTTEKATAIKKVIDHGGKRIKELMQKVSTALRK